MSWSHASLLSLLLAGPVAAVPSQPGRQAAAELQEALLSVTVNGTAAAEPVVLLRDGGNRFYATAELLKSWRLRRDRLPSVTRNGELYYLLNAVAGARIAIDETAQALTITVRPDTIELTRISYASVAMSDEMVGGEGGFLNYDVSGQVAEGDTSLGGAFEAGVFTGFGVGITNFIGRWSSGGAGLVRLDSNWTIDDPAGMRSLRFGDGISRGGVGGSPLRFGGVQLARNFAVQPGFVTIPLPTLGGSAAVPSVIDIYVNETLRDSHDVPPGPFEIIDIPIVTGNGDVQLVVRDLLGREQLFSQSYYVSPRLLRKGLLDYSYEVGFLRQSFGHKSNDYGALMVSATHRYGFSDNFTGEAHVEAARDVQVAGLGANMVVRGIGHLEGSFAVSRSDLGTGMFGGLGFERRTQDFSLAARAEFASDSYMSLAGISGWRPPASTIQAFAGVPFGSGSLGLSYLRRDGRSEPDIEHLGATLSMRMGRLGSLHLAARQSLRSDKGTAAELSLLLPLGPQSSTSAGASLLNRRPTIKTAFQKNAPFGEGLGYRFATSKGAFDRIEGRITLRTSFGEYDTQLTWTDGKTGVRLSVAGGVGLVERRLFAARRLDQSFAAVKVGDYANVRVYADNQLVGRTDRSGTVVVPKLRPFDRNVIRVEASDLPLDAEIGSEELTVRPYDRHGVAVDFAAAPTNGAVLRILLEDGNPLPAGAVVRIDGQEDEFVSAPGGEVYVTGLAPENVVTASWSGGTCRFPLHFGATDEPQPSLGDFQCRGMVQ